MGMDVKRAAGPTTRRSALLQKKRSPWTRSGTTRVRTFTATSTEATGVRDTASPTTTRSAPCFAVQMSDG
jgi:hypothetical protein